MTQSYPAVYSVGLSVVLEFWNIFDILDFLSYFTIIFFILISKLSVMKQYEHTILLSKSQTYH
ncbi:hypothetical protein BpHYR1_038320 [Brachionus plicatilis]|uniref:Uncharacterized protein n=1 Tax=Brachionus plicatilis TaxID=10195 RepID=A0A3M7RRP4_BRAPC|nr:hypothetical protein BpHYR1_038320 [Brachionus plicatilis]